VPHTPAPGARCMAHASATAALVAPAGFALRASACRARTPWRAVALPAVASAAQPHLHIAPRAQEHPGRTVHARLGVPSPRCWTGSSQRATLRAAPPSSARCRAGRGHRPPQQRTASRPTNFGIVVRCTAPRRGQTGSSHCARGPKRWCAARLLRRYADAPSGPSMGTWARSGAPPAARQGPC
jgi:hypothetical protein